MLDLLKSDLFIFYRGKSQSNNHLENIVFFFRPFSEQIREWCPENLVL